MKKTIAEVIDRLTILSLKREFGNGVEYQEEYEKYTRAVANFVRNNDNYDPQYFYKLLEANRKIWLAEAEIGKWALEVRKWNMKRQEIKNEISKTFGGPWDYKDYYKNL